MQKYKYKNKYDKYQYKYQDSECSNFPNLPTIIPIKQRIVVIGDVHGDYKNTLNILKLAKLINDKLQWIAEPLDTVLVQVGDQIDRCRPIGNNSCSRSDATYNDENSDTKILLLFTILHLQALKHGGAVYSLLGNHEIMNVQGNFNYVSYKGIVEYGQNSLDQNNGLNNRYNLFKPGQTISTFLACTRQTAIIIGDFLFVHAGIMLDLIKKYNINGKNDLHILNAIIRKWLLNKIDTSQIDDFLNNQQLSPFWPRLYGKLKANQKNCSTDIDDVLQILQIKGMIIGHTPQMYNNDGINSTCNKKIWRVDVGTSDAFKTINDLTDTTKQIQALEILNNSTFNIIK